MKILRKSIAVLLSVCSCVCSVKAEFLSEFEKDLINVDLWETVGKSENDYLENEGNALIYHDNGGILGDAYNNTENSGFTVYHDFKKPLNTESISV